MGKRNSKKVEHFFQKHADQYFREGYVEESTERFYFETRKRIIRDFIGKTRGSILDIGAGPGVMSLPMLDDSDSQLTVVDVSEEMLNLIEKQMAHGGVKRKKNIKLVHGDILDQEFDEHSFDIIICAGILAHISSIDLLFSKTARWLKPDGKYVIQMTNASNPAGFLQIFLANFRNIYNYKLNYTTKRTIEHGFIKHGLTIIKERRYHLRLPGMKRLGRTCLIPIEKMIYTFCRIKWLRFMGQDIIYLVTKRSNSV